MGVTDESYVDETRIWRTQPLITIVKHFTEHYNVCVLLDS